MFCVSFLLMLVQQELPILMTDIREMCLAGK